MDEMKPYLIGLIVLSAVFSGTDIIIDATTTVRPSVAVALVNDSTVFNCSTTSEEVDWILELDQYSQPVIYSHGAVKETYKHRFRVDRYTHNYTKFFNLILHSVTKEDGGLYMCIASQNDQGGKVRLTVLETEPVCESNLNVDGLIGPNSCAIKPETVQLSCSVRYSGSEVPELQWIKTDETIVINSSKCSDSGNVYTCNLTMESALQMEGSSYVCQTTQSMTRQYNCTSGVFRIIYALGNHTELTRTVNDKVNCFVNSSSRSCTLSWIYDNGTTNWTESHEQVIEFKRAGRFICQAICVIRNNNCTLTIMTATVSEKPLTIMSVTISEKLLTIMTDRPIVSTEPEDDDNHVVGIIVTVVVAVIVVVAIVVCAIIICLRKRKRQNSQRDVLRKIKPMADENRGRRVRGLTVLDDKLFVTFETSNIIEVFASFRTPYRKLMVVGLMAPGTIAACVKTSCLYVMDQISNSRKKILKVKPDGTVIKIWETDDDDNGRISVNRDGNVVMTVYDKRKVKIYSPDGKLLIDKTIDLSGTQIIYTFHSINLSDGNFIIGHGTYKSDIHQVCKFDARGNVLQSFGNKRGSGYAELNCPAYVTERNDGSILVSDRDNDRIIQLNSELELVGIVFTKEKGNVSLPEAMYVYEETDTPLLFLSCNEKPHSGGYVLVLRLSQ